MMDNLKVLSGNRKRDCFLSGWIPPRISFDLLGLVEMTVVISQNTSQNEVPITIYLSPDAANNGTELTSLHLIKWLNNVICSGY